MDSRSRQLESEPGTRHPGCFCRYYTRTVTERRYTPFRGAAFTDRTTATQRHQKGCRHYQPPSRSRTLQTGLYGLRRLFSCAVELSITLTTGAGGRSISPNIIVRPMVDTYQSPLFRVMGLLYTEIFRRHSDQEYVELAVTRAAKLIHHGKSSPYEVNLNGESALCIWVEVSTHQPCALVVLFYI